MEIKIGSIIVGIAALFLAIFKFKNFDSKISFFWIAFALLTQGFVNYFGQDLWLIFVALGTIVIGVIQGIRKKDKTYVLLVGVIAALIVQVLSFLFLNKH